MDEGFPELTIWISETPLLKSGSFGVEITTINADPKDVNFIVEEVEKFYESTKKIDTEMAHFRVMYKENTCLDGILENGKFLRGVKMS